MKPSLLEKFKLEFEHQESAVDFKALIARINFKKKMRVQK